MDQITIQGLSKPVTRLIMGVDKKQDFDELCRLWDEYIEIGGNTFDTAYIYGGGQCETNLGQWLQLRGNREQLVILGKGAHHDKNGPRVNPEAILHDLNTSLERMQVDYIDIYMLHRDDPNVPVSVIIDALNGHIQEGKVKVIGTSNWTWQRIQEANDYAASKGLVGFSCSSPNLSLAKPNEPRWTGCVSADEETLAWHRRTGIPLLSWSSQAGGFFSGRFTPEDTSNSEMVRVYYSDANWERLRRAESLGRSKGASAIQIALAYVLNQAFPTAALIGPVQPDELYSSHEGGGIKLSEQEVAWLNLETDQV